MRALLQARRDRRNTELDEHRAGDVRLGVGDKVLLDTEHANPPSRSPRWMGPFKVLPCPAPNTCRLRLDVLA